MFAIIAYFLVFCFFLFAESCSFTVVVIYVQFSFCLFFFCLFVSICLLVWSSHRISTQYFTFMMWLCEGIMSSRLTAFHSSSLDQN